MCYETRAMRQDDYSIYNRAVRFWNFDMTVLLTSIGDLGVLKRMHFSNFVEQRYRRLFLTKLKKTPTPLNTTAT
jgi:hypothetical protein